MHFLAIAKDDPEVYVTVCFWTATGETAEVQSMIVDTPTMVSWCWGRGKNRGSAGGVSGGRRGWHPEWATSSSLNVPPVLSLDLC